MWVSSPPHQTSHTKVLCLPLTCTQLAPTGTHSLGATAWGPPGLRLESILQGCSLHNPVTSMCCIIWTLYLWEELTTCRLSEHVLGILKTKDSLPLRLGVGSVDISFHIQPPVTCPTSPSPKPGGFPAQNREAFLLISQPAK